MGRVDEVIDLCDDSDADEKPAAKRARSSVAAAAAPAPTPAPQAGSGNALLAQLAAERRARLGPAQQAPPPSTEAPPADKLRLLTYNVWFESTETPIEKRMEGIGAVVQAEKPDVWAFQECTPQIEHLLSRAPWWRQYDVSEAPEESSYFTLMGVRRGSSSACFVRTSFGNSRQGRDLLRVELDLGFGCKLLAGTSHLESFTGKRSTGSGERVEQLRLALGDLEACRCPNVIFAGDLNWSDDTDGDMARMLPTGWSDAWPTLNAGQLGNTFDCAANQMLLGNMKKRLDRVLFKCRDFDATDVRMVGREPLVGLTYLKKAYTGEVKRLPVLPSDHFGLVLTLSRKAGQVLRRVAV
jgi:tyrosyl-DNA phosphodiesterase 2